jgi:cytochrome c-type biogenesis protein CcmH/NrfG
MANTATTASTANAPLRATQAFAVAGICLVAGLGIGYLAQGWQSHRSATQPAAITASSSIAPIPGIPATAPQGLPQPTPNQAQPAAGAASPHSGMATAAGRMPTLADMKRMADKQAEPLLDKLKTDPKNVDLLSQVASIYHKTHQFQDAVTYYRRAVQADPKNVALRTKLAASLYRTGDVDGGITQLKLALTYDPKDANALFDLGMMRLQGKQDGKGALAAWQLLLKSNPQLSSERRATVQKLMADVLTTLSDQSGVQGAKSNDANK